MRLTDPVRPCWASWQPAFEISVVVMLNIPVLRIRAGFWSYDTDFDGWVRQNPLSICSVSVSAAGSQACEYVYFQGGSYQDEVVESTSPNLTPSDALLSNIEA